MGCNSRPGGAWDKCGLSLAWSCCALRCSCVAGAACRAEALVAGQGAGTRPEAPQHAWAPVAAALGTLTCLARVMIIHIIISLHLLF